MTTAHNDLGSVRAFLIDMDGVMYEGQRAIPGAAEFVRYLDRRAVPYLYLTNNATLTQAQYVAKLGSLGISATEPQIYTSSLATADYLAGRGVRSAYAIGETGLTEALRGKGIEVASSGAGVECVVVGLDRHVTYEKLRQAALAIEKGAAFYATNTDNSLPTEAGRAPGAGALVAAIEVATRTQAEVIGKPRTEIFRQALRRLDARAAETAAIGDRLETDIAGGEAAGTRTILVLTGIATRLAAEAYTPQPDWIFDDLARLQEALNEVWN